MCVSVCEQASRVTGLSGATSEVRNPQRHKAFHAIDAVSHARHSVAVEHPSRSCCVERTRAVAVLDQHLPREDHHGDVNGRRHYLWRAVDRDGNVHSARTASIMMPQRCNFAAKKLVI